jgi:hypothetical protein
VPRLDCLLFSGQFGLTHRHQIKNRLIDGIYRLPSLVLLVLLVAAAIIQIEKEALFASTKQSRQAGQAGRRADKAVGPACFVLIALTSVFFENSLRNLFFLDIYG